MREILNINEKWAFTKEATAVPEVMPEKWYWVTLPHTWNAIDGQDGGNDFYRGTCYYAKEIEKVELPKAREEKEGIQYYLELLGANASADVYVNGKKLAHHDGGYSTWRVNITDALCDGKNLFVIAVDNSKNETVYPQQADFTFYGGLYRDVNIIAVEESHFDLDYFGGPGIKVTPEVNGEDASVEVEVYLTNAKADQSLVYTVKDMEGNVVAEKKAAATEKKNVFEDRSDEIMETSITARLLSFPNVIITSHQGFFTEEALQAISETTLQNAMDYVNGVHTANEVKAS